MRKYQSFLLVFLMSLALSLPGQDSLQLTSTINQPVNSGEEPIYVPAPSSQIQNNIGPEKIQRSLFEEIMSKYVLIFAFLILLMEFLLIFFAKLNGQQGISIFTVTIIITSGLFLITAGYNREQISPIVGLLGTIAGYLLGNITPGRPNDKNG